MSVNNPCTHALVIKHCCVIYSVSFHLFSLLTSNVLNYERNRKFTKQYKHIQTRDFINIWTLNICLWVCLCLWWRHADKQLAGNMSNLAIPILFMTKIMNCHFSSELKTIVKKIFELYVKCSSTLYCYYYYKGRRKANHFDYIVLIPSLLRYAT